MTESFTPDDRQAMRAYLQRCEVRLSTLHRVATSFIGGAGLLLLIPIFFRDVIQGVLDAFLLQIPANLFSGESGYIVTAVALLMLAYPLALSLVIPLYGVYLLLKDVIQFYFTLYSPGFAPSLQNPTFALTGVAFSEDESPRVKTEVMRYQYQPDHMNFMMAFSEGARSRYFDSIIELTHGNILPETRSLDKLRSAGRLPEEMNEHDTLEVLRFNAAFGIARSLDRTLAQEVALTEMAIVRAILYLRRLVLRYVKTLLMFLWTTAVSFIMLPFLQDGLHHIPVFLVLGVGYTVWSIGVMPIIRMPLQWIYRHRQGDVNPEHVDKQLQLMETRVAPFHYAAILFSFIGLVLVIVGLGTH